MSFHVPRTSRPALLPVLGLAVAAVGSAVLLLVTTSTWGLGVTYDSVVYLQAGDDLTVDLPQPRDEGGEPLYWWAPVYSLALQAFGGGEGGARLLHALLLLAGTLTVGIVGWRAAGARVGVIAGALYAASPAVAAVHLDLLAEPLYLLLATVALGLIAERRAGAAGLVTAAAILTRYAGLPLVVTGALLLRGRDRIVFLAVSVPPYLAWLLRNQLAAGEATGRQLRWHPPGWDTVGDGLRSLQHLVVTPGELESVSLPLVDAGVLLQGAIAATLIVVVVRAERRRAPALVAAAVVYAGLYCVFLAATVTLFDAGTPVNDRLLTPLVPTLAITTAWLARSSPVAAAVLVGLLTLATLQQSRTTDLYGRDYSGQVWSAARFDGIALPRGELHSNWPAAVAYFTGRSPRRLPEPLDVHTLDPNDDFERELARVVRDVRAGRTSLVILDGRRFLELPQLDQAASLALAALDDHCREETETITICTADTTP